MFHIEALRSSVEALRANKFRAFLTALGLVIGNASVILVVTISLTSRDYLLAQIERLGSNMIYASYEAGGNGAVTANADFVKLADVDAVREKLGSRIVAATSVMNNFDRMRIEGKEEDVTITGTDQYYLPVRNIEVLAGRFFDGDEVRDRRHVAVLMQKLARRLFGSQGAALGKTVKLHGLPFTVIGTFRERQTSLGLSELTGENVLIPLTVLKFFSQIERIDPMYVQARTASDVEPLTSEVRSILEGRHRQGARYTVSNLTEILATAKSVASVLTAVLVLVSAIALIISGIGIMNIMLVTVTERTREIGLRMAVGASRHAVLEQFLTEAVALSVAGGVIGILVGISIPLSVRFFTDAVRVPISATSVFVAFGVSLAVGVIFGLLPANRASQLNPTDALRYE